MKRVPIGMTELQLKKQNKHTFDTSALLLQSYQELKQL